MKQLNSNTYNSEALTASKYLHRNEAVKNAGAEKNLWLSTAYLSTQTIKTHHENLWESPWLVMGSVFWFFLEFVRVSLGRRAFWPLLCTTPFLLCQWAPCSPKIHTPSDSPTKETGFEKQAHVNNTLRREISWGKASGNNFMGRHSLGKWRMWQKRLECKEWEKHQSLFNSLKKEQGTDICMCIEM